MVRRALLVGSQVLCLAGVHDDVEVMADVVAAQGFEVRTLTEGDASRAGILAAYAELGQDCGADDAALVYYSGHGGRFTNRLRTKDPALPSWLQFIVPTDYDHSDNGTFTGILAEELSVLQHDLT